MVLNVRQRVVDVVVLLVSSPGGECSSEQMQLFRAELLAILIYRSFDVRNKKPAQHGHGEFEYLLFTIYGNIVKDYHYPNLFMI